MAYSVNGTLMGTNHLAVTYRRRICGYCADELPLHQIMAAGEINGLPWHIDADGCIYPCAVVSEMLEAEEQGRLAKKCSGIDREYEEAMCRAKAEMNVSNMDIIKNQMTRAEEDRRYEEDLRALQQRARLGLDFERSMLVVDFLMRRN